MERNKTRWSLVLGFAGTVVLLLALIDPLEGFPFVLGGGLAVTIGALLAVSRWRRLLVGGLVLAAVGCAAMVVLSSLGGVGGSSALPASWGLAILPYPLGALILLVGSVLLLRELMRARRPEGTRSPSGA